jgi:DNA polymerase-3 subunit gamma/tau
VREQHALGVEPAALLHGLLETCHGVSRAKVGGGEDPALAAEEREAYADWAGRLGFAALHRLWQLLLKGHGEVQTAPSPIEAAEMALLRVVHASQLPDPTDLMRRLANGEALPSPPAAAGPAPGAGEVQAPLLALPADFEALVAALEQDGKYLMAETLRSGVGLVRYEPPDLVLRPARALPADFSRELAAMLRAATGQPWEITISDGPAEPSLLDQERAGEAARREAVLAMPVVKAALEAFAGAELESYSLGQSGPSERSACA